MKTETDEEIVASNEARRRLKLRAMKEVRVKMGIKENTMKKREGTKGRRKKRCTNVKRGKKVKRAHTGNSMNTSVGIQNRGTENGRGWGLETWNVSCKDYHLGARGSKQALKSP